MAWERTICVPNIVVLILITAFASAHGRSLQGVPATNAEDKECLRALTTSLGTSNFWNNTRHQIQFDNRDRITYLDLQDTGLAADSFPAGLSRCTRLLHLSMARNDLSGPLPRDLCQRLPPRLTILDLSHNHFSGSIPPGIKDCVQLYNLNLANNRLSGPVPSELASLPYLVHLNLSYNSLSGPIPPSFTTSRPSTQPAPFPAFDFEGNPDLCGKPLPTSYCPPPPHHAKGHQVLIASAASSLLLLCFLATCLGMMRHQWRSKECTDSAAAISVDQMFDFHLRVSWKSLLQATSNFDDSNLLGKGGSSNVYKGKLHPHGNVVAIKVFHCELNIQPCNVQKQFLTELEVLGKLRHRNLARILGHCYNLQDTMAIILDFMPMGSLDALLHRNQMNALPHQNDRQSEQLPLSTAMDLTARLHILLGIVEGLSYLHHEYDNKCCIIHGDLKPANVLLDNWMIPRISDFGLARIIADTTGTGTSMSVPWKQRILSSNGRGWSFGYTAPECAQQGMVSRKVDIFSLGMVILEVMTGERPSSSKLGENQALPDWVRSALASGAVDAVIEPALVEEMSHLKKWGVVDMAALLELGCRCASYKPADRPDVYQVRTFLHSLVHEDFRAPDARSVLEYV